MGQRSRDQILNLLPKASVGAEVGVWKGDFSAQLVDALQPKTLYLIDPWVINEDRIHRKAWYGSDGRPDMEAIYESVRLRFRKELQQGSVVIVRQPSSVALSALSDNSLDFIYIDGDHEYSGVRKDCFLAYDKVRNGGLICGDDYAAGGWWKDGVIRAFHDLISQRNVLIAYTSGSQIVLRKRDGDYRV